MAYRSATSSNVAATRKTKLRSLDSGVGDLLFSPPRHFTPQFQDMFDLLFSPPRHFAHGLEMHVRDIADFNNSPAGPKVRE